MSVVYLIAFIGGLLLAVRIMIAGVERPRTEHPRGERTFRVTPPMIVAFAVIFGVVGYILTRRQAGSGISQFVIAAALGAVASGFTAHAVKKWWTVTPEHEVDDERYILQGQVARVTKTIASGVDGEVEFEIDEQRHIMPARGLDGSVLAAGSDAVIDRIEGDVVYVESWLEVEKRL
jgi:hypothetical protein